MKAAAGRRRARISPDPARVRAKLLRWYRRNARSFFWREPGALTDFQVLLVEFLLWKTSARAEPVIRRITLAHPTPESVVRRSVEELREDLRPLGLHGRRSRCMHAFATELLEHHGGVVPHDVASLQRLTGIGQYAARATACVLGGSTLMPVDANTSRIFGRLHGGEGPGVREPGADWDARMAGFVPSREPRRLLWATMDLAASTCTARLPRCGSCPLAAECVTGAEILESQVEGEALGAVGPAAGAGASRPRRTTRAR